jgi:hypothetical protein
MAAGGVGERSSEPGGFTLARGFCSGMHDRSTCCLWAVKDGINLRSSHRSAGLLYCCTTKSILTCRPTLIRHDGLI